MTTTDHVSCADALELCRDLLLEQEEGIYARTLATIEAMIAQRGCEHLDPAVKDGRLTTYCDVVIFG